MDEVTAESRPRRLVRRARAVMKWGFAAGLAAALAAGGWAISVHADAPGIILVQDEIPLDEGPVVWAADGGPTLNPDAGEAWISDTDPAASVAASAPNDQAATKAPALLKPSVQTASARVSASTDASAVHQPKPLPKPARTLTPVPTGPTVVAFRVETERSAHEASPGSAPPAQAMDGPIIIGPGMVIQ